MKIIKLIKLFMYKLIMAQINNFHELCEYGINNCDSYEMIGKKRYLQDYICHYNKNGFYTNMSQPACSYMHVLPKTIESCDNLDLYQLGCWITSEEFCPNKYPKEYTTIPYKFKQRAMVSGIMTKLMGQFVIDRLVNKYAIQRYESVNQLLGYESIMKNNSYLFDSLTPNYVTLVFDDNNNFPKHEIIKKLSNNGLTYTKSMLELYNDPNHNSFPFIMASYFNLFDIRNSRDLAVPQNLTSQALFDDLYKNTIAIEIVDMDWNKNDDEDSSTKSDMWNDIRKAIDDFNFVQFNRLI